MLEHRIKFADLPKPYYFSAPNTAAVMDRARYWRGWHAPIVSVDLLVVASGPTQNQAGAGVFTWVPAPSVDLVK